MFLRSWGVVRLEIDGALTASPMGPVGHDQLICEQTGRGGPERGR